MNSFDEIKKLITNANKIGLTYHVSPDGDAIGSLLALREALVKLNKDVVVFSKDDLRKNIPLRFLKDINKIDGTNFKVDKNVDLLIILDCGNIERVSCDCDFNNTVTVGIDHHISNELYCKYNLIDAKASSTGEIVFQVIKYLDVNIDSNIATYLYTSIMTDTGGLRFECSSQKTFNIVGELVATGFNFVKIYENLFLSQTYSKVKLLGLVYENLKVVDEKISIARVTNEMLEKSGAVDEQLGDVVSICLTIENVEVSVLIKDYLNKVKVSLRSKNDINVCEIAQKFGGGGHVKAAAFTTDLSMNEIEKVLIEEIRKCYGV